MSLEGSVLGTAVTKKRGLPHSVEVIVSINNIETRTAHADSRPVFSIWVFGMLLFETLCISIERLSLNTLHLYSIYFHCCRRVSSTKQLCEHNIASFQHYTHTVQC